MRVWRRAESGEALGVECKQLEVGPCVQKHREPTHRGASGRVLAGLVVLCHVGKHVQQGLAIRILSDHVRGDGVLVNDGQHHLSIHLHAQPHQVEHA